MDSKGKNNDLKSKNVGQMIEFVLIGKLKTSVDVHLNKDYWKL